MKFWGNELDELIQVVPAIKRLELKNVGCWERINLEFIPGLNIITEDGWAVGKTTIFQSILKAVHPSCCSGSRLTPRCDKPEGHISVELMSATLRSTIGRDRIPATAWDPRGSLSTGQQYFNYLSSILEVAPADTAVLVEDSVVGCMDTSFNPKLEKLFNHAPCQIICQIAHRLGEFNFPRARVYACFTGRNDKARIKLL